MMEIGVIGFGLMLMARARKNCKWKNLTIIMMVHQGRELYLNAIPMAESFKYHVNQCRRNSFYELRVLLRRWSCGFQV